MVTYNMLMHDMQLQARVIVPCIPSSIAMVARRGSQEAGTGTCLCSKPEDPSMFFNPLPVTYCKHGLDSSMLAALVHRWSSRRLGAASEGRSGKAR